MARALGQKYRLVEGAVPGREPGKHPATRAFQAFRIHVNRELAELEAGEREKAQREDLLRYQVNEIEAARLQDGRRRRQATWWLCLRRKSQMRPSPRGWWR